MDRALLPGFSTWTAQTPLAAAVSAASLSQAQLTPGKSVVARLSPTADVDFAVPPEKPADPASHSGLFDVKIEQPGTYVVGLGAGAWIDVLKDGKALSSIGHDHGPACSTLRKMVEFPLQPGRYLLQVSGAPDAKLSILVTKRP
ncbi:MAG: homogentisate 1,2-dioxygenase [Phenylobacterium sp.]|nr:MAG: homogentisate 1,2-dioxygenase [Phenylobacterium sp.]